MTLGKGCDSGTCQPLCFLTLSAVVTSLLPSLLSLVLLRLDRLQPGGGPQASAAAPFCLHDLCEISKFEIDDRLIESKSRQFGA